MALSVSDKIEIPHTEIQWSAIHAQGSGGQNVNKVASAIHLRFDIKASSLPLRIKQRLLARADSRINRDGVVVIKAQRYRDQEKNRRDALQRLHAMISSAMVSPKKRFKTRPTKASVRRRLDAKNKRGKQKALRRKVTD
ncbi:MAG: alternative ribosome rescue aminoacyl-tRNA hydrolase ArfB [Candidatus Thiodiazotropha lotti]|uniref:Aminoacyl-tRNA hydrolase n=1 Tax=Candidatus Thiodiazotropha lotti TaxID=2792787 RepID=A0A9E4K3D4_9GAMM|nr:aminoacyl-tRNA hydrolase [Candidatus Thiodiazotropha lotti]MCG7929402.1 aminoacyl-tRNA hydrolase [Candidatus Thiodiazotropha lotti]MCG7938010.1 aminoacyl-tRNA hydrolase [Candidatus Thiodiazotropha lotti]MCG7989402.1 aminoacyl-tRNA hydrolase [Candidatus Thiodiazotropha lotti]MCG8003403.1 aminoacyl-tRNA hydrolase [Candidatus Thiodiazotropha lotti]